MFRIFKECKHESASNIVNIYGDPIKYNNAKSIKLCNKCHRIIFVDNKDNKKNKS